MIMAVVKYTRNGYPLVIYIPDKNYGPNIGVLKPGLKQAQP